MYFDFEDLKVYFEKNEFIYNRKTLVFLHGWGGGVSSFKFVTNFFKGNVNYINLDFPPFNLSSKLIRPFSIEDYTLLVESLLKSLNVKKYSIVAHSFGGRIALNLASRVCRSKIEVESMVLTGCAGFKNKSLKLKFKKIIYKTKKGLNKIKLYPTKKLQNSGSNDYKNLDDIMKKTFNYIVNFDETFLLKNISCKTLLFWGKKDKETPFYFTKILKKHIKNSEVICFDDCGHFVYLEKSKEFLLVLKNFFEIY